MKPIRLRITDPLSQFKDVVICIWDFKYDQNKKHLVYNYEAVVHNNLIPLENLNNQDCPVGKQFQEYTVTIVHKLIESTQKLIENQYGTRSINDSRCFVLDIEKSHSK